MRGNCTLEECVKSVRFRRSYASVRECLNDIGIKEWLMIAIEAGMTIAGYLFPEDKD